MLAFLENLQDHRDQAVQVGYARPLEPFEEHLHFVAKLVVVGQSIDPLRVVTDSIFHHEEDILKGTRVCFLQKVHQVLGQDFRGTPVGPIVEIAEDVGRVELFMGLDIVLTEKLDDLRFVVGLLDHLYSLLALDKSGNGDQLIESHELGVDVPDDFWFDLHLGCLHAAFIMKILEKFDSFL